TSTRPLWAVPRGSASVAVPAQGRRYRGVVRAEAAGGGLHLVNELDVEQYLRGMGEVLEPGWPADSLRAQAIAARTYALRAMAKDGRLCNSQQCQVYLGETVEYAAMNRAVADTRGQVLVQGGSLIEAVYSANGGGVSATPIEGFGADFGEFPYLRSAPYPTLDPSPWTVRLELAAFAARVGYPGRATAARVSQAGPSGRALEVTVDGEAGPLAVPGLRFVEILGLRSSLFSIRVGDAEVVGPPDPGQPTTGAVGDLRPPEGVPTVVRSGREGLGRSPWIALALLLLAGWGTGAASTFRGARPAPGGRGR
ncbi:MAG TPA: SpoIID/LytB domain-containing protein, partial [Acidimicrobiales bacterium]|nr:SpoIID/LytB domain-containing protein [Acidimicrobiales bacterium]